MATIHQLGLGAVTLVGQSMGANTAMLTTATHPELVRMLVMIEGSPDGPELLADGEPAIAAQTRESLEQWPVPFADPSAAASFFVGKGFDPIAWTGGLEHRDGGLWPRFEIDTLVACMADLGSRNYWPQWRAIHCPALVILGERGIFHKHAEQVVRQLSPASIVTIPGSGHDVHLDAPEAWVRSLANFANSLTAAS